MGVNHLELPVWGLTGVCSIFTHTLSFAIIFILPCQILHPNKLKIITAVWPISRNPKSRNEECFSLGGLKAEPLFSPQAMPACHMEGP